MQPDEDLDALIARADGAMYAPRRPGRPSDGCRSPRRGRRQPALVTGSPFNCCRAQGRVLLGGAGRHVPSVPFCLDRKFDACLCIQSGPIGRTYA